MPLPRHDMKGLSEHYAVCMCVLLSVSEPKKRVFTRHGIERQRTSESLDYIN
jgi:hypothetical protein